jgi:Peptidase A4 family
MTISEATKRAPRRRGVTGLVALCFMLAPAAAAANTITSQNWSGYAAHRTGVKFRTVSASWREPSGACTAGSESYSASWVGIGGYSLSSLAMEQIGTELDCRANGTKSIYAWYELVPAASQTIGMTVAGGDLMHAAITVVGKRVTLTLADETRHESFTRTKTPKTVDTTSAEWIEEAPSACSTSGSCTTLTLANFGKVHFSGASATTTTGAQGAVTSSLWKTTRMLLGYSKRSGAFIATATKGHATPSALRSSGHAFTVTYSGPTARTGTKGTGTSSGNPTPGTGPGGGGFPGAGGGLPGGGAPGGGGPGGGGAP